MEAVTATDGPLTWEGETMGRLLTINEVADALHVSEATVRALVSRRMIRHERIGTGRGSIRIPEDAVEEYRQSRTVAVNTNGGEAARPAPAVKYRPRHLKT